MVSLKQWMRCESLSDAEMAERIGGLSAEGVRKLRFRVRDPSARVAVRIAQITRGTVGISDLYSEAGLRRAAASTEARP